MLKRERGKAPLSLGDGLTGRRTGVTVVDTGERDADGMEIITNIYAESEDDEDEMPQKGSHAMSDFKVQRDDSDDDQAGHVNLPPQTPARVPVTKTRAVGLNDVTQRATNQMARQATKQPTKQSAATRTPTSTRKLKIVSAVPVSRAPSKASSSQSSFSSKPASQTGPKITKVSAIKSIQPVPAKPQPALQRKTQPSSNDTLDSIDSPASNPYVAPPKKFEPKAFPAAKPASESVFKTPARTSNFYEDSPADSTPGIPTPGFKPAEFKPASFQFGAPKDVFDIPEDEPMNMGMDMDMDMSMGMHDDSVGHFEHQEEIKSVRPTDVFLSPNVPHSRGSLFGSQDAPRESLFSSQEASKPKAKGKEPKAKPTKERKPSFAEKYKPRDFSKGTDDIFKSFKVPTKTASSKTAPSKTAPKKAAASKTTKKAAPKKAAPKKSARADASMDLTDDDTDAMDFTSIAKNSSSGNASKSVQSKADSSQDSIDFDDGGDFGGADYDIPVDNSIDDSMEASGRNPFDVSVNYREISTVDDSRMEYEDSDDDFYDKSYKMEDDGDDDDDEYNSAVDESMAGGALPSPPLTTSRRKRSRRPTQPPVRYWMGERVVYELQKAQDGRFVPTIQEVIRVPDKEIEEAEKAKRKRKKNFDIDDAMAEAEADANENADEGVASTTNWEKEKKADVEVVNYTAEEGDPEMHMETVVYTHDGCMVRLIGGGQKPERNSRHHLHHFYLLSGAVDATIGDTVLRIKAGCPFIVPRGTQFALKNASGTIEALLFYVRSHDTLLKYEERVAQAELDAMEYENPEEVEA
ncbi:hypothetical protein CJU89_2158 [Yarrowia sp. B02]|nr:hypothetical protein CJU89_2158 [Yarrowia sp. B02]